MKDQSLAQHEVLVAYLKIFLIEAARQEKQFDQDNPAKPSGHQSVVMQHLIDLIENNFCEVHAPQDYADLLHVSSKTLA